MIMQARIIIKDRQHFDDFWRDLGLVGELGPREARLWADSARRGLALNWEKQQTPGGQPWAKLAPFTQRERRRLGFAAKAPILKRTGDLQRSFTDATHPRHIAQVGHWNGGTVVTIGAAENPKTPGRIPLLNQGGINSSGRFVPAREFIGFSRTALRWVENTGDAVILQRVERLG